MKFSLAISPCPNDTFIFNQLLHHNDDFEFDLKLYDVEQLNQLAEEEKFDIIKVSFATYLKLKDKYNLLSVGAALGHGVGPLLVSNKQNDEGKSINFSTAKIAVPGLHTTAYLLLKSAYPEAKNIVEMVFSDIENAVINNEVDLGLLIHEGRFTYKEKGLNLIKDMGEWWEETHELPIPLGCIIIKKSFNNDIKKSIEDAIKHSIKSAWNQYPTLDPFITEHAQEMSEDVMRAHIELYVNDESYNLSDKAIEAIKKLEDVSQKNTLTM